MSLVIETPPVPLEVKEHGVVRVTGTRVTLDTIVGAFNEGASAEEIAQQYPSALLSDIYAVIAYYLREKKAIDAYIRERESRSQMVQTEVEARFDAAGIRERLLARRPNVE